MKAVPIFCLLLVCDFLYGQPAVPKIAADYFRVSPFNKPFGTFLERLINDPAITGKNILKKTDSTFFFMEGLSNSYNPFFFKAIRTKIILAEKEESFAIDSAGNFQLIYLYQLVGYAPAGPEGVKDVKDEFDKFCRKYRKNFSSELSRNLSRDGIQSGLIRDFAYLDLPYFPLTAAWESSKNQEENLFAITLRFWVTGNEAWLKIPPDGF